VFVTGNKVLDTPGLVCMTGAGIFQADSGATGKSKEMKAV
jgi:hypothetical protein